jgi:signal transduction histidine kinase
MLCLLEDLLALARVGRLGQTIEPVESSLVVDEVIAGLASQIIAAGMDVRKGELPSLRVPQTLLVQLFDNLIGNALRYGGKDGGCIEVGGERFGVRTQFYVRDHGRGIPLDERERVFDLFYRGSSSGGIEGTGVGLATVQKIAHLMGGRAWVEETAGGGSTFLVEVTEEPAGSND